MITLIVAMGNNNEIGFNNDMPWHLPNDLKYFKEETMNNVVVMGRKTYESIGKPLPNRKSVVISRQALDLPDEVTVINDLEQIKDIAAQYEDKNVFIIGGAEIYKQTLHMADRLFITKINQTFEADAFFPEIDEADWEETFSKQ